MTLAPDTVQTETLLRTAVAAFRHQAAPRPDGKAVTAALLQLEKQAKQERFTIPQADLLGTWQLCLSAGKQAKYKAGQPVGSGFYIPQLAIASIQFALDPVQPNRLQIANELRVGPLKIRFTGPARYPGKKNLLAFDFTQLSIHCFGLRLYQGKFAARKYQASTFEATAIGKLPFFAFFAATEDYIAARGRGGGLAIWVKAS